jgi:hypothetical protein
VVSFTPLQLYSRAKSPRYPLDRKLGWPQSLSGRYGGVKILFPYRDPNSDPSVVQTITGRNTVSDTAERREIKQSKLDSKHISSTSYDCIRLYFHCLITAVGILRADHVTSLYPQKLALASPTSGGCSVGIVR